MVGVRIVKTQRHARIHTQTHIPRPISYHGRGLNLLDGARLDHVQEAAEALCVVHVRAWGLSVVYVSAQSTPHRLRRPIPLPHTTSTDRPHHPSTHASTPPPWDGLALGLSLHFPLHVARTCPSLSACAKVWSSGKGSPSTDSIHACTSFSVVFGRSIEWGGTGGDGGGSEQRWLSAGAGCPLMSWHQHHRIDHPANPSHGHHQHAHTHTSALPPNALTQLYVVLGAGHPCYLAPCPLPLDCSFNALASSLILAIRAARRLLFCGRPVIGRPVFLEMEWMWGVKMRMGIDRFQAGNAHWAACPRGGKSNNTSAARLWI